MNVAVAIFVGVVLGAVGLAVLAVVFAVGWAAGRRIVAAARRWIAWRGVRNAQQRNRADLRNSVARMRSRD